MGPTDPANLPWHGVSHCPGDSGPPRALPHRCLGSPNWELVKSWRRGSLEAAALPHQLAPRPGLRGAGRAERPPHPDPCQRPRLVSLLRCCRRTGEPVVAVRSPSAEPPPRASPRGQLGCYRPAITSDFFPISNKVPTREEICDPPTPRDRTLRGDEAQGPVPGEPPPRPPLTAFSTRGHTLLRLLCGGRGEDEPSGAMRTPSQDANPAAA